MWSNAAFSTYVHAAFPLASLLQAMVEVLAFAQRLLAEEGKLASILTDMTRHSVCKQFSRLMALRIYTTPSGV